MIPYRRPNSFDKLTIECLENHPDPYVTVGMLAKYWAVSRKQIYKQLEMGTLIAIRFGPRLLRIHRSEALRFEQDAKMRPFSPETPRPLDGVSITCVNTQPAKGSSPGRQVADRARIPA